MPTKPFSERPLPAVHAAILELHLISIRSLTQVRFRDSEIRQIRCATERAAIAVELAASGHRRGYNLQRAHEAMIVSLGLMRLLHIEGMLARKPYDQVRRKADQILFGLEQLDDSSVESWSTIELVPIEDVASDSGKEDSLVKPLLARVAETMRLISADWSPTAESPPGPRAKTA
jgi:hypothetical protein